MNNQKPGHAKVYSGNNVKPIAIMDRRAVNGKRIKTQDKIELYGFELIEKEVGDAGKCGRLYLPINWVGKRVKIIRVD